MINLHEIQMLDKAPSHPIFTVLMCDLDNTVEVAEAKQVVNQSKELTHTLRNKLTRYLSRLEAKEDNVFLTTQDPWFEEYKSLPVLSQLIISSLIPVWNRPNNLGVDIVRKAAIAKINLAMNLIIDLKANLNYFYEDSGIPEEQIGLVRTTALRGTPTDYNNCCAVRPEVQRFIEELSCKYNHIHFEIAEHLGFDLDSDALSMFASKTRNKNPIINIGRVAFAVADAVTTTINYEELPRDLVDDIMVEIAS